jgi:hypothetical protein
MKRFDNSLVLDSAPVRACTDGLKTYMRGAFVVQLGPETQPAEGRFEGWVQEVDFCCEQRFRSSEELLKFLGERFELSRAAAEKTKADEENRIRPQKKARKNEQP